MVLLRRTPGYRHCKCCESSSTLPSHSFAHVSGGLCADTAAVRLLVASLTDPSGGRGDYGGIDVPREIHLQRGDRRVIGAAQRSAVPHNGVGLAAFVAVSFVGVYQGALGSMYSRICTDGVSLAADQA
jgi:hypothetical protein